MPRYFLSSNESKFVTLQQVLPDLEMRAMELDELQSLDARAVIEHKLAQALTIEPGEYVVEDTSLVVPSLGGLPGPLVKWFLHAVGPQGLAEMVLATGQPTATAHTWIGYQTPDSEPAFFHAEVPGTIVSPRGEDGFGWDFIFVPDGSDQTFAQLGPAGKHPFSMRRRAAEKLKAYIDGVHDQTAS